MIASELGTNWAPNQGLVSVTSKNLLSTFIGLRKKSQKYRVLVKSTSSLTAKKSTSWKSSATASLLPPLVTQTLLLGLYSLRGQTLGPLYFTNYTLRSVLCGSLQITPKTNAVLTMNTSDDLSQATLHSWIIPLLKRWIWSMVVESQGLDIYHLNSSFQPSCAKLFFINTA